MSTLTWLHLSDLHAQSADKFNRDKVVLDALFDDIKKHKDELKPDFIVFTGDVAYHGKAEEYDLAMKHFFEPLLETTGVSPEKLFIVPGNHDVDRDVVKLLSPDTVRFLNDRDKVNEFLAPEKDSLRQRRLFFQTLGDYTRFIEENFAKHWTDECDPTFACVRFYEHQADDGNTKKVALLGLNSTWLSGFVRDARGQVDDYGNLLTGEHQVRTAVKQAQDADICIALMHHPFEWLREFDRIDVESWLRKACHFILRGHMHRPEFAVEATLEGETNIIPAGATYDRRKYPNGYNFVRLNLETGEGTIYLRRYSDRRREWIKDIDATGEEQDGQWEFRWGKAPPPTRPATVITIGEEKEEEWIAPELAKVMAPVVSLRTTLFELDARLRNLGDAFSRIAREAEWAKREGRLRDSSFEVILMAWGDCKRGSYFKLLTNAPLAKAVLPSLEEHFFALEEGARNLDTAINNDNRGALLHAVENFEYHLRSFQESVIAHLKRRAGDD